MKMYRTETITWHVPVAKRAHSNTTMMKHWVHIFNTALLKYSMSVQNGMTLKQRI